MPVISNKIWHRKKEFLEFEGWRSPLGRNVEVLCSLRGKENEFRSSLLSKNKVIKPYQIHSNSILVVTAEALNSTALEPLDPETFEPSNSESDGMLTNEQDIYLMISIADCLPIYIYDADKKTIGLLHAGRKGTQQFILRNAIEIMIKQFGSRPEDISLLFGPSICPKCYDYDLWENNIKQANEMGVSNIINPQICTAENLDLFYSYRKEKGIKGRMFAAIRIKTPHLSLASEKL